MFDSLKWEREYYRKNKDIINEKRRERYRTNESSRDKIKLREYNVRQKLRDSIIKAYGGKCKCCGEKGNGFLTVDHINNNGAAHRKLRKSSTGIYKDVVKGGFSDEYALLCFNCNCSKGIYGACYHNISMTKTNRDECNGN